MKVDSVCLCAWWIAWLSLSVVLFGARPASAAGPASVESSTSENASNPSGCPVHCSQYEACIENRCVEMCRIGCRAGTICTPSGECEPIPEPAEPLLTEAEQQRRAGEESADSQVLLFADVAGVIGFGLALGFEWGVQDALISRVRFMNTGVMSHAVYAENEYRRFEWDFGTSIGYRRYEGAWGNLRGFYYGGGLDYAAVQVADRVEADLHETLHSIAPYGEFGYRWVFGNVAVGFGPTFSLRYPIGSGFFSTRPERCAVLVKCDEPESRRLEGVMHLEIGWFQ